MMSRDPVNFKEVVARSESVPTMGRLDGPGETPAWILDTQRVQGDSSVPLIAVRPTY